MGRLERGVEVVVLLGLGFLFLIGAYLGGIGTPLLQLISGISIANIIGGLALFREYRLGGKQSQVFVMTTRSQIIDLLGRLGKTPYHPSTLDVPVWTQTNIEQKSKFLKKNAINKLNTLDSVIRRYNPLVKDYNVLADFSDEQALRNELVEACTKAVDSLD